MWIHCLLRLQECRDKPEIFNYQRIQLSNNKFTNGFLGGKLNLAWLQCLSKQGYSTKDYTHGSREAVSHPEKSINVQGTFHFDTPSQSSPCTASRGDNMITTFISDWNGHNIPSSRRDDMTSFFNDNRNLITRRLHEYNKNEGAGYTAWKFWEEKECSVKD